MRQPGGGSAKLKTVTWAGNSTCTPVVGRSRSVGTRTVNSTASPAGTEVGRTSTWAVADGRAGEPGRHGGQGDQDPHARRLSQRASSMAT